MGDTLIVAGGFQSLVQRRQICMNAIVHIDGVIALRFGERGGGFLEVLRIVEQAVGMVMQAGVDRSLRG